MILARCGMAMGLPLAAFVVATSCASAPPASDAARAATPSGTGAAHREPGEAVSDADHGARDASDARVEHGEVADADAGAAPGEATDGAAASSEAPAVDAAVAAAVPPPARTTKPVPAKRAKERRCPASGVMHMWPPEQPTGDDMMRRADHAWDGPDFNRCRALIPDHDYPKLTGRKVGFYVQPNGSIREVCAPGALHPGEAYSACIVSALRDEVAAIPGSKGRKEITLPGEWER